MLKKVLFFLFSLILTVSIIHIPTFINQNIELVSPLTFSPQIALNLWFPKAGANYEGKEVPQITAKAAYFVETNTGEVLYQKNSSQRMPIASLTKIMTAILTLENRKLDDEVLISSSSARMEPDRMGLKTGEKLTVEELLYGLFLVSGNDAAEALAESSLGSSEAFVEMMNKKSFQLGMKNTRFINPTGLQEDGKNQYSSAIDVALMSRFAIKQFPELVEISSTPHILLPSSKLHQSFDLDSGINLLTTYQGVLGFKTGYTPEAGLTLVTLARKDGHEVIGVILNSEDRRNEARLLLDYSFSKLR